MAGNSEGKDCPIKTTQKCRFKCIRSKVEKKG